MSLNNYVDKIYCINLKKRTDRWEFVSDEFKKINCTVERFEAYDGSSLDYRSNMTPGEAGCYFSHMNILEHMIYNNISKAIVFEDDVVFCDQFNEKFNEFYKQLPDNHTLVYIGGNYTGEVLKIELEQISPNVLKGIGILALHAYMLDLDTAKKIYEILQKNKLTEPVDNIFIKYQQMYPTYVFKPNLVYQKPGYSDNRNGFRDYNSVFIN